jgi:hypothetical protein
MMVLSTFHIQAEANKGLKKQNVIVGGCQPREIMVLSTFYIQVEANEGSEKLNVIIEPLYSSFRE